MFKIPMIATLCLGLMAPQYAAAKTYSCNVTPDYSRDWIAKTLVFNIDDDSGDVHVFDGIINQFVGKPVTGALSVETAKRITIKWETRRVKDDYGNSSARFQFRASYFKDNGKMIISSIPGGWDNMFGGRGRCAVSSDASWGAVLHNAKSDYFSRRGKERFFIAGEWIKFPP